MADYPNNNLNEGLDKEFRKLTESFFRDLEVKPDRKFEVKSFKFFENQHRNHISIDKYFSNFVCPWNMALEIGLYYKAEQIWEEAICIALKWENKKSERLHKGTPYYFLGVSQILAEKVDQGLISMHQALEEDKETPGKDLSESPALDLVLLNPDEDRQAFKIKVQEISDILKSYLEDYRTERNKSLTFDGFKSKFLDRSKLRDEAFSVVHGLFKIDQVRRMNPHLFNNYLAFYNQTSVLFAFCRVVDVLLQKAVDNGNLQVKVNDYNLHEYMKSLVENEEGKDICSGKFSNIKEDRENDFEGTLMTILAENYELREDSTVTHWEADLATTKFFRDFGAHYVGPPNNSSESTVAKNYTEVVHENFEDIVQRILNVLFLTLENHY